MRGLKRYKIHKGVMIVLILLLFCCITCYFVLTVQVNFNSQITASTVAVYETIKSILVVIISTIGVNLLSSILIDKNSKNYFLNEIMLNDVIGSSEFYNCMNDNVKEDMYNALECNIFNQNTIKSSMYKSIRDKLNNMSNNYYYTKCSYSVTCTVHDTYIEKVIKRTTHIRSYDECKTLKRHKIIGFSSKRISGLQSFEKISLKINNEKIDESDCKEIPANEDNWQEQNGYNYSIDYIYQKNLRIYNNKDTIIVMEYRTRTSVDDRMSTFRVSLPCKEFNLHFSLTQQEKYRLVGSAYGFLDDADNSNNNNSKANITIEFSDWIFKHDGAVVVILDK